MKTTALLGMLGLLLALCLHPAPAHAQFDRTWVSSSIGSDANNCDRPTPCATFQAALNNTNGGGEINCVDSGHSQTISLSIAKSITIDCGGMFGAVKVPGPGFCAIALTADGITVRLRNLSIQGFGVGGAGICVLNAINALFVENSTIFGFNMGASVGIQFMPPSGSSQLYVTDSFLTRNGVDGAGGSGIAIQPSGTASVRAVIERTRVESNALGILIDGTSSSGRTVVQISDSVVAGNSLNGVTVRQAGTVINRAAVLANLGNGILANAGALIHLGGSTVAGNALSGLAINGSGQIFSYQDNKTKGNGVDTAPSGVLALN